MPFKTLPEVEKAFLGDYSARVEAYLNVKVFDEAFQLKDTLKIETFQEVVKAFYSEHYQPDPSADARDKDLSDLREKISVGVVTGTVWNAFQETLAIDTGIPAAGSLSDIFMRRANLTNFPSRFSYCGQLLNIFETWIWCNEFSQFITKARGKPISRSAAMTYVEGFFGQWEALAKSEGLRVMREAWDRQYSTLIVPIKEFQTLLLLTMISQTGSFLDRADHLERMCRGIHPTLASLHRLMCPKSWDLGYVKENRDNINGIAPYHNLEPHWLMKYIVQELRKAPSACRESSTNDTKNRNRSFYFQRKNNRSCSEGDGSRGAGAKSARRDNHRPAGEGERDNKRARH